MSGSYVRSAAVRVGDARLLGLIYITRVPATADKPHGLDYSLTMHAPSGARFVGFDNAHRLPGKQGRGGAKDHRHRQSQVKPYEYTDGGALIAAFWTEVESVLSEEGIEL